MWKNTKELAQSGPNAIIENTLNCKELQSSPHGSQLCVNKNQTSYFCGFENTLFWNYFIPALWVEKWNLLPSGEILQLFLIGIKILDWSGTIFQRNASTSAPSFWLLSDARLQWDCNKGLAIPCNYAMESPWKTFDSE